ncbi:hypothetical protein C8R45DRAFT_921949 [Mycena sanguinolenta]|nr:hypothetical protein C8R45DRAFT_921949 [Mycena sanguinolenta]
MAGYFLQCRVWWATQAPQLAQLAVEVVLSTLIGGKKERHAVQQNNQDKQAICASLHTVVTLERAKRESQREVHLKRCFNLGLVSIVTAGTEADRAAVSDIEVQRRSLILSPRISSMTTTRMDSTALEGMELARSTSPASAQSGCDRGETNQHKIAHGLSLGVPTSNWIICVGWAVIGGTDACIMALHPIPFKTHGAMTIAWFIWWWLPRQVHPEERSGIVGVFTSGKFIAALANVTQAAHDLYHFTRSDLAPSVIYGWLIASRISLFVPMAVCGIRDSEYDILCIPHFTHWTSSTDTTAITWAVLFPGRGRIRIPPPVTTGWR